MRHLSAARRDRPKPVGSWQYPPEELKLLSNEVHIWLVLYADLHTKLGDMFQLLSEDERSKADRYHLSKDRQKFILRHGLLRQILVRYLRSNAARLVFQKNDYGKPFLKTGLEEKSVFFSMTHSIDLVLYAFSRDSEIGIDVEHVDSFPDMNGIVQRFFSSPERSEFSLLPAEKRSGAFFRGWTCKEALLKGIGKGLSNGLDNFCVSLDPEKNAEIQDMDSQSFETKEWSLNVFETFPDYVSAMAVKSAGRQYAVRYLRCT